MEESIETKEQKARKDWKFERAVVLTRTTPDGKTQYRISPRELMHEKDVPMGGFYSNWCNTAERAWHAAMCRRWCKTYSRDFW